jgi:hypothetical protein
MDKIELKIKNQIVDGENKQILDLLNKNYQDFDKIDSY